MAGGPQDLSELEKDPRLFLYTSLTAGSSHIVTATSRIETILRANRIPFQYIDTATDEKAKRLWIRRAGKRKLPALVKDGFVIGDLEQVEEWNEFGELKEAIGPCPPAGAPVAPPALPLPVKPTATAGSSKITPSAGASKIAASSASAPAHQQPIALPGAAEIAARNNPLPKSSPDDAAKPETMTSAPAEKEKSIKAAAAAAGSKIDHLSAPPSAVASGTATPAEKKDEKDTTAKKAGVDHLSAPPSAIPSGTVTPAEKEETAKSQATDIKKSEEETKIAEESFKESPPQKIYEDLASVISSVEGLQMGDGAKVGEQQAGKAEDATKSVED